jgi:hypothetical protein
MTTDERHEAAAEVTALREPQPDINKAPPPTGATGLHRYAINALTTFAFIGIFLTIGLITVDWDDSSRGVLIKILVLVSVGFIASAAIAVFAASRDTYRSSGPDRE